MEWMYLVNKESTYAEVQWTNKRTFPTFVNTVLCPRGHR